MGVKVTFLTTSPHVKVKSDYRSEFSSLSNWKKEAWKNQGFNGIRTRDLREWSHTLGARSIYWVYIFPWGVKWCEVFKNYSYLNCGDRWKWRMIIALENLLQWSFFTFNYNRSSNMNYFIYTSLLHTSPRPLNKVPLLIFIVAQFSMLGLFYILVVAQPNRQYHFEVI